MRYLSLLLLLLVTLLPVTAGAESNCLDSEGEAAIVNGDIPSAKAEAINRAKWNAIEEAVGVDVKAQSVVQNLMMVDESISKQVNGSVKNFKILSAKQQEDTMKVAIKACVEPAKAKDAVAGLALNNAVSVFVLAKDPTGNASGYQETNILSQTLIDKLVERGFTVADAAAAQALNDKAVESAIRGGNLLGLRGLMYKFLTNVMLVGKVDYTVSTKRGEDIGYGLSMPFNNVTARFTYRLISKDSTGQLVILAAGSEQGKGLAGNVADAASESLKDVAGKVTPLLVEKVAAHLKASTRKVLVKVQGVKELSDNFAVKEVLQGLSWVTAVDERGLGEFTVGYPENSIYLANSIRQKENFRLIGFTPATVTVEYRK
ncbi:hypothetical protein GMSM_26380 [Geomonas sp. Red276]